MQQPMVSDTTIASFSAASKLENDVSLVPLSRWDQKLLDGMSMGMKFLSIMRWYVWSIHIFIRSTCTIFWGCLRTAWK